MLSNLDMLEAEIYKSIIYTQRKAPNLGRLVRGYGASYYCCYFFLVDSS